MFRAKGVPCGLLSESPLRIAIGEACVPASKARRRHGKRPWLAASPMVLRGLLRTLRAVARLPQGSPLLPGSRPGGASTGCGALDVAPCHCVRVPCRCQGACCPPEWAWHFCTQETCIRHCLSKPLYTAPSQLRPLVQHVLPAMPSWRVSAEIVHRMPACSTDVAGETMPGLIAHQLAILKQALLQSLPLSLPVAAQLAWETPLH